MELTKTLLAVLGIGFALAGVAVAWGTDRFAGLTLLVIGAFLLALPFMTYRSDD